MYQRISYNGKSLRCIAIAWLIAFLVLRRSFNSKIVSSLVKVPNKAIDTFNELSTSKEITPMIEFGTLSYGRLQRSNDPVLRKIYSQARNVSKLNTDTLLNITEK